jgi:hypothetical protein
VGGSVERIVVQHDNSRAREPRPVCRMLGIGVQEERARVPRHLDEAKAPVLVLVMSDAGSPIEHHHACDVVPLARGAELAALEAEDLVVLNLDVQSAAATALGFLPKMKEHTDRGPFGG